MLRHTCVWAALVFLSSFLCGYTWHLLTVFFARYLAIAIVSTPTGSQVGIFMDYLGRSHYVSVLSDIQEPSVYTRFAERAGGDCLIGMGLVRNSSTLQADAVSMLIMRTSCYSLAAFLFTWAIWSALLTRLFSPQSGIQRELVPRCPKLIWMIPGQVALTIILWYMIYPRSRLGNGVFEMHDHMPLVASITGCVAACVLAVPPLLRSIVVRRYSSICVRCKYPKHGGACTCVDCGQALGIDAIMRCFWAQLGKRLFLWLVVLTLAFVAWEASVPIDWPLGWGWTSRWLFIQPTQ